MKKIWVLNVKGSSRFIVLICDLEILFSLWIIFFFWVPLLLDFKDMLLLPFSAPMTMIFKKKVSQIIIINSVGGNLELGLSNN